MKTRYTIKKEDAIAFQHIFSEAFKFGAECEAGRNEVDCSELLMSWSNKCLSDIAAVEHVLTAYHNHEDNKGQLMQSPMEYVTFMSAGFKMLEWLKAQQD